MILPEGGILEKVCYLIDRVWEDLIYDRCTDLPTLFKPDEIDKKWLPYQLPLVGFTSDLPFDANEEEMRRMMENAITYWNEKPSEYGVIDLAIKMITGNNYRVRGYHDFRMQESETCLTEELAGLDPNVLDFPAKKYIGAQALITTANTFMIVDLPGGGFINPDDFSFLVFTYDSIDPNNEAIYEIDSLNPPAATGTIKGSFNSVHMGYINWELMGYMDDFVSEVRIVDEGEGDLYYDNLDPGNPTFSVGDQVHGMTSGAHGVITANQYEGGLGLMSLRHLFRRFQDDEVIRAASGANATSRGKLQGILNRDLLRFLMGGDTQKPFSERIDVVYVDLLDEFLTAGDLDQWIIGNYGAGAEPSVPSPGGDLLLDTDAWVLFDKTRAYEWEDMIASSKWYVDTADCYPRMHFWVNSGATEGWYVGIDYSTKTLHLGEFNVAGVSFSHPVPFVKEQVPDVIRVTALHESTGVRIKVAVDGEEYINQYVASPYSNEGSVGVRGGGTTLGTDLSRCRLIEANVLPSEGDRVGPLP